MLAALCSNVDVHYEALARPENIVLVDVVPAHELVDGDSEAPCNEIQ